MDLRTVTAVEGERSCPECNELSESMATAKKMYKEIVQVYGEKINTMQAVKNKIMKMNVAKLYKGSLAFIKSTNHKLEEYKKAVSREYTAVMSLSTEMLCDGYFASKLWKRQKFGVTGHVLKKDIKISQTKAMVNLNIYYATFKEGIISFPFAKSRNDRLIRIEYTEIAQDLINKLQNVDDDVNSRKIALIQAVKWPNVKNGEISLKRPHSPIRKERDHSDKNEVNNGTSSKQPRSAIPEKRDNNSRTTLIRAEEQMDEVNDGTSSKRPRSSIREERDQNRTKALTPAEEQMKVVNDRTSSKRPRSSIYEGMNQIRTPRHIFYNHPDPRLQIPAPEYVNGNNGVRVQASRGNLQRLSNLREAGLKVRDDVRRNPRLILSNVPMAMSGEDVVANLIKFNLPGRDREAVKIIYMYPPHRYFTRWVIETTAENRKHLLSLPELLLGRTSCTVNDYIWLRQCFKCLNFGHFARVCRNDARCSYCAGAHQREECKATEGPPTCANCAAEELPERAHQATNRKICPIQQRRIAEIAHLVNYG